MCRLLLGLGLVTLALCAPPVSRSKEDIQAFREFLDTLRNDRGIVVKSPPANGWVDSGKLEGDIVLDEFLVDDIVEGYASGRNAYQWPNTRWPDNTVIWQFGDGEFNDEQKEAILAGMKEIEERTCIRFRERERETSYVRLTGNADGCYATVGYLAARGIHTYNLARNTPGWGCFRHTTIIHEWLHIIGFFHMQSTHNRDEYVEIMWQNIQSGTANNFQGYSEATLSNLGLPYEYISTMHYPDTAFTVNGQPTIVAKKEFEGVMGQTVFVTDMDYLRVDRHYNCPGAWD